MVAALVWGLFYLSSIDSGTKGKIIYTDGNNGVVLPPTVVSGDLIPDFELKNYDGITMRLADFRGKALVVNSWASWCGYCARELKDAVSIQKEFPRDVVFVAINRAESRDVAKKFTDNLGISRDLVFLLDPSDSFYASLGGTATPETVFISDEGFIVDRAQGVADTDILREKVINLLK